MYMSKSTIAAGAFLSLMLGCSGQIGEPAGGGTAGPGGTGSSGTSGTGSSGTPGPGSTGTTGTTTGGPTGGPAMNCSSGAITDIDSTPLRRLTNAEYLNTVSDLLGDVTKLNLDFAGELTTENFPFLDNAAAQQTPPALAHQYLDAAEKIATDTVTNRLSKVLTCDPVAAGEQVC